MIRTGIDSCSDEGDWANLGAVGSYLSKALPDFDPRNYGYQKLTEMIEAIGLFEIKRDDKGVMIKDARKS